MYHRKSMFGNTKPRNSHFMWLTRTNIAYIVSMDDYEDQEIEYPIDGILDLHTFSPGEVKSLIPEYIEACLERRIYQLRIIHGKGTGTLRTMVHAILERDSRVESFKLDSGSSSWGATLVNLKR